MFKLIVFVYCALYGWWLLLAIFKQYDQSSFICAIARCCSIFLPPVNSGIEPFSPHQCWWCFTYVRDHRWYKSQTFEMIVISSHFTSDCNLISHWLPLFRSSFYQEMHQARLQLLESSERQVNRRIVGDRLGKNRGCNKALMEGSMTTYILRISSVGTYRHQRIEILKMRWFSWIIPKKGCKLWTIHKSDWIQ